MTPEAQRVAIAEACGMEVIGWTQSIITDEPVPLYAGEQAHCYVPDFLNDLNAMHEAEKTLTYLPDYLFHLREVCGPFPDAECEWNDIWWSDVVRATAPQRAEAFLRTLNLWKD